MHYFQVQRLNVYQIIYQMVLDEEMLVYQRVNFICHLSDEVLHDMLALDLDVTVHPTHHHAGFVGVGF